MASVHVVCGHLVRLNPRPVPVWPTSDWGFTWVPWFMMLSGFVLSFSRLTSKDPDKLEPISVFFFKRVRGIYPLYLAGLLSAAAVSAVSTGRPYSLGTFGETIASTLLLQAWFPWMTEQVNQSP